ncbi:receptor-like protein kinase [Gossypium australe]|uniref:Receptor-like protein kinase n=1 Tax=Gossypium australe TaxID=47621 RepID=A0A5B6UI87_9ROSI|nr:receptor-like protein kinase [Gossypium australe]
MTYNEELIRILAREIKELRNKCIALMKVLWQRHGVKEATWEPEEAMGKQYPNLFTGTKIPKGESCNNSFLVKSEQWFRNHKYKIKKGEKRTWIGEKIKGYSELASGHDIALQVRDKSIWLRAMILVLRISYLKLALGHGIVLPKLAQIQRLLEIESHYPPIFCYIRTLVCLSLGGKLAC